MDKGAVAHLEGELRETRERLQSLIEEYETALEELKSSSGELVSGNQEPQSANEEMETSKEELQSVNEELHTVSAELNGEVEALDRANADLRNLFESTNVATVFLGADLVIRSVTPAVAKMFRISPHVDATARTRGADISFIDLTELTRAEAQQKVLIADLRHRTRNLLTVVQASATLTLNMGGSLQGFADRLAALGRVQDLVNQVDDEGVELGEIIRLEPGAHAVVPDGRISFGGPPVRLHLDRLQAIARAVHELATDAMKFGAPKQDRAGLAVHWHIENGPDHASRVVLEWQEGGVVMPPLSRRGAATGAR